MKHYIVAILAFAALSVGCSKNETDTDPKNKITDYADKYNWLEITSTPAKNADVFFLYPSAYLGEEFSCAVTDASMRAVAMGYRRGQAEVYAASCNIFMPYYRQIQPTQFLSLPLDEQDRIMREISAVDAIAAFDYYINNYNNGRPFVLAGHSQGSEVMKYVLEYIHNNKPELLDRMVAAYIIGVSVTADYLAALPKLKFAERNDDTGVIISWNTEAPNMDGKPNPVLRKGAIAINPISWSRGEERATEQESLGSRLLIDGEYTKVMNYADAKVNISRGVVECSTIKTDKDFGFGIPGNYHGGDYSFYYYNLEANVEERVNAFFD